MRANNHYASAYAEVRTDIVEILKKGNHAHASLGEVEAALTRYFNENEKYFELPVPGQGTKTSANKPKSMIDSKQSIWSTSAETPNRPSELIRPADIVDKEIKIFIKPTKETFVGPPVRLKPLSEWFFSNYTPRHLLGSFGEYCYKMLGSDPVKYHQAIIDGQQLLMKLLTKDESPLTNGVVIFGLGGMKSQNERIKYTKTRIIPIMLYLRYLSKASLRHWLYLIPTEHGSVESLDGRFSQTMLDWTKQYTGSKSSCHMPVIRIGIEIGRLHHILQSVVVREGNVSFQSERARGIPQVDKYEMYPFYDPNEIMNQTNVMKDYQKYVNKIKQRVDYHEV